MKTPTLKSIPCRKSIFPGCHRLKQKLALTLGIAVASLLLPAKTSAQCLTATAGGSWQDAAMTSQTGTFTATFDATPSAAPTNAVVALSNGPQTAYANFACLARFNTSGDIDARNGGAYAAASTIPYSAGVSYHFRLVVNIGAQTYSIYVTPAGGSELTVGLNYAFRISDTTLNYWGVFVDTSANGGAGSVSACNFSDSNEGPFGGSPATIPGTVQAENYDTGGQGVAYNVGSINGTDNGYRSDGVDLEATSDTGGGVDLGWTSGGQWFKYTVNVSTAGTYTVSFRVAGGQGAVTDAFHLSNSSGTNLSGNVNVPNTGGWQTWTTVTASVTLPVGQQILTLNQDNGGWNLNYASFTSSVATVATPSFNPGSGTYSSAQNVTITSATGGASIRYTTDGSTPTSTTGTIYSGPVNISSTATLKAIAYESGFNDSAVASATYTISIGEGPFGGSPAAIPGTVQAENYDTGGQGVAYSVGSINGSDNGYRSDGVDLELTSDTGGGVDLGWTTGGQWFKYTTNVATAGTYTVSFRVAAPSAVTDAFHLSNSSGTNLSGSVNLPATGGYQTWITVTASVTLPAGQQILTLNQDNGGWNINYMGFATSSGSGLNPNLPPGENFDLTNWQLQLPIGSAGNPTTISQPQLQTFTDAYFYTDPNDGAMTFFTPENGVHTANSSFPRSELRELKPGGDWPLTGTHIMTATLKVEDTLAHVAIGQIHIGNGGTPTSTKPLLELFYYSTGQITLLLETSPSGGGPETNITTVPLGTKFSYTVKVVGNALTIIVNGVTNTYTINSSYDSENFYFKAGDYLQTTGSSGTIGAHVAFYALNVVHQ